MNNPGPIPNDRPPIADLVCTDIQARKQAGIDTYGTPLQPFNGRNAHWDAYEELLDFANYWRQELEERRELLAAIDSLIAAKNQGSLMDLLSAIAELEILRAGVK